jgi:glyoxylase-like metal-dependent hydrolase (beta-lactamase superfamily II)
VAVGPGVYAFIGSGGAASAGNLGRIGNAGFVVGERAVVAIDTGTSYAHGQALLAGIAAVTDKPVRLALVTHTRPEFLFGGTAFRERGIPVAMHARCAHLMASRCETCLKTLRQQVGDVPMRGTEMYRPDRTFEASHAVEGFGRPLRVLYFGHSSGPGDIAVHDQRSGVVFAGGLLDNRRIPDIQDGDLAGWRRALHELRALKPAALVPGHGPAGPVAMVDAVERYLEQLETRVKALLAEGASLLDVPDAADLPEFADWDQYDLVHRRNAAVAFIRFERELLFK